MQRRARVFEQGCGLDGCAVGVRHGVVPRVHAQGGHAGGPRSRRLDHPGQALGHLCGSLGGGPGRAANGNFALTDFRVTDSRVLVALRQVRTNGKQSLTQDTTFVGVRGSDATKGYAWLTGQGLRANFRTVGFGAQGILRPGNGQVPPAAQTLRLNFAGKDTVTVRVQEPPEGGEKRLTFEATGAAPAPPELVGAGEGKK